MQRRVSGLHEPRFPRRNQRFDVPLEIEEIQRAGGPYAPLLLEGGAGRNRADGVGCS